MPSAGALIVGSLLAPAILRLVRPAFALAVGLVVAAVGCGLLTQVGGASGLAVLVTGSVVLNLGMAPVGTLATDLVVTTAPPERAGAAAAISETSSEFGGERSIAILGSIGTAVYRNVMANAIPDGGPRQAMEAARATLGGAVAVAKRLPDEVGTALLASARGAFAQAFELTAAISSLVVVLPAIVPAFLLRGVRVGTEPGRPSDLEADGSVVESAQ
jgi:DHA2 family multidrug resistance protein-like MFS transporter